MADLEMTGISSRFDGYCSDCTNTHLAGGALPTQHQACLAAVTQAAFATAVEALKPGRLASDIWGAAKGVYDRFSVPIPHYIGHQVGAGVNELPRLVAYDHTPIQANMVFAVEPGAYDGAGGSFGVRCEKVVWVRERGAEVLSQFDWGIQGSLGEDRG
jgi:Xaa-Pro aminopeptidase